MLDAVAAKTGGAASFVNVETDIFRSESEDM